MHMPERHYDINILPPDISPYEVGNCGIEYVTTLDSGYAGPHVMVNAVTHGNELCGAIALDFLFRQDIKPQRGKLTLCFANFAAYLSFDPLCPTTSRFIHEDFNRLWCTNVLDGPRESVELRRARMIRPVINEVDFLLDLHSMHQSCSPMTMAGPHAKGRELAMAIGYPNLVVSDSGHAAGTRLRDYKQFSVPSDPRNALLVECGQHWEKSSVTVAINTTLKFLSHLDVVDKKLVEIHITDDSWPRPRAIEVTKTITIKTDRFAFTDKFSGMEIIESKGVVLAHDGDEPIVTPHNNCILIMPSLRLLKGETAVRLGRYVD